MEFQWEPIEDDVTPEITSDGPFLSHYIMLYHVISCYIHFFITGNLQKLELHQLLGSCLPIPGIDGADKTPFFHARFEGLAIISYYILW